SRSTAHDSVWEAGQLLEAVGRDEEVVLDAQPAAAVPVDAGLDREHHALLEGAAARLVWIRRLVRTCADAVTDRMRRLARIADRGEAFPHHAVELGNRADARYAVAGVAVDAQQLLLELVVVGPEIADHGVRHVIGP